MTWHLRVTRTSVDGICFLRLDGRLGTAASGELIERVVAAINEGERRLLVDLSGVDYASSAGLLALDAIAGRTYVAGGTLVLCGLTEPVRWVMELAGLLPQFTIEPTAVDALARLQQSA
jgi:stage II sporulation protein AA (anti-sigma F factor antagonist)